MQVRVFMAFLAAGLLSISLAAQAPPVSWTCPMHPDVLEDVTGSCRVCAMRLEPVRLVSRWTCPVHAVIDASKPGRCRICRRDLLQITAALTWTCAGASEVNALERGTCPDGSPMIARYTPRPHGDHNPKHGGIFFMAPDNWHHLEGTYPAAGRFRVYVYDDYSRPLTLAQARKVRGRVVTKEAFDPKTRTTRELASAPLALARNGAFFEARVEPLALPARLTAKIAFASGTRESRFDFMFPAYSVDEPGSSTSERGNVTEPAAATVSAGRSIVALLADLKTRAKEVDALVKAGSLSAVYFPALQAKDIALDIQAQLAGLKAGATYGGATNGGATNVPSTYVPPTYVAPTFRSALPSAPSAAIVEHHVKQIVLAAYELDSYGDIGDGQKVDEAYRRFSAAISSLDSVLARQ
jgi:hypothetical protein